MLEHVKLVSFGPLPLLQWGKLGAINLVIGGNGAGKTFLLKALYVGMRTVEEHRRGEDRRTDAEILAAKLHWTFQAEKLGDLVTKGAAEPLRADLTIDGTAFAFGFGRDTTKEVRIHRNDMKPRLSNSVFLPAKEVLSLQGAILRSREEDQAFGFDDTYLDLVRALRRPTTKGKNYQEFARAREVLHELLGGRVEYELTGNRWTFRRGNHRFAIGVTSEGTKKIGILDTLLGNRFLDRGSVVFIDEPESALHPHAITQLLDIVAALAVNGIQFILSSHSYFVIKKLALIAVAQKMSIPVLSAGPEGWVHADLKDGMPENSIVQESISLYEQEIDQVLG